MGSIITLTAFLKASVVSIGVLVDTGVGVFLGKSELIAVTVGSITEGYEILYLTSEVE